METIHAAFKISRDRDQQYIPPGRLRHYDLIIFDEAALADGRDAFNVALRPTLDKDNSKAIFISTPRGKNNWFSDFFYRGFSDEFKEWASIRATYKDNPRMSETDIAEARK